jgi:hypothetical protein
VLKKSIRFSASTKEPQIVPLQGFSPLYSISTGGSMTHTLFELDVLKRRKGFRMTNRYLLTFAMTVVGLVVSASLGQASIIGPGGSGPPDLLGVCNGGVGPATATGAACLGASATLETSVSGTVSTASFTLPYTEYVFSDPGNVFCAGCLDFLVKISNNAGSANAVRRVTITPFNASQTDVGINIVTGAPGVPVVVGVTPGTVDRDNTGGVIGFNYVGGVFAPGTASVLLEVQTDATQWVPGTLGAIDGVPGSGPGLGAAPEPNLVGLLFGGSLALIGLARRFKMIG